MTTKTPPLVLTASQERANDVTALLKARNPLIWIVSNEEERVEGHLFDAMLNAKFAPRVWDIAEGVVKGLGTNRKALGPETSPPGKVLSLIRAASQVRPEAPPEQKEKGAWVLRGFPTFINGGNGALLLRQLQNNIRELPNTKLDVAQAMIILSPSATVPPEIAAMTTVIEWPMPDRREMAQILNDALAPQQAMFPNGIPTKIKEAAVDAAVGLSGPEAQACFSRSLINRRLDPAMISKEKRRIVAREGLLEWYDPLPGGLNAVGGLDVLKGWLTERTLAFGADAREYGLPAPRGALLIGISGCGKSLTAKATATAFDRPLLRLDLGAIKDSLVGKSERNLRRVFEVIKSIGRCVVWLDEVEKALAGAINGARDGGVSADALGALLTWMQEQQGEAFIIATANDISGLPPEFLRKGRFDEIFFVDLPNASERVEVLKAALREHKRGDIKIDHKKVALACEKFTGAEIAAIVPDALFAGFADNGREIKTADLLSAASKVVPLSKTASEKINNLRNWAKANARHATSPEKPEAASPQSRYHRQLDIDPEQAEA